MRVAANALDDQIHTPARDEDDEDGASDYVHKGRAEQNKSAHDRCGDQRVHDQLLEEHPESTFDLVFCGHLTTISVVTFDMLVTVSIVGV